MTSAFLHARLCCYHLSSVVVPDLDLPRSLDWNAFRFTIPTHLRLYARFIPGYGSFVPTFSVDSFVRYPRFWDSLLLVGLPVTFVHHGLRTFCLWLYRLPRAHHTRSHIYHRSRFTTFSCCCRFVPLLHTLPTRYWMHTRTTLSSHTTRYCTTRFRTRSSHPLPRALLVCTVTTFTATLPRYCCTIRSRYFILRTFCIFTCVFLRLVRIFVRLFCANVHYLFPVLYDHTDVDPTLLHFDHLCLLPAYTYRCLAFSSALTPSHVPTVGRTTAMPATADYLPLHLASHRYIVW